MTYEGRSRTGVAVLDAPPSDAALLPVLRDPPVCAPPLPLEAHLGRIEPALVAPDADLPVGAVVVEGPSPAPAPCAPIGLIPVDPW